jgi:hypothetical protein
MKSVKNYGGNASKTSALAARLAFPFREWKYGSFLGPKERRAKQIQQIYSKEPFIRQFLPPFQKAVGW